MPLREELALARRALSGELDGPNACPDAVAARNELVNSIIPFVYKTALKFADKTGVEAGDLVNHAVEVVLRKFRSFDPDYRSKKAPNGVRFLTYFGHVIRNSMFEYILTHGGVIRLPGSAFDKPATRESAARARKMVSLDAVREDHRGGQSFDMEDVLADDDDVDVAERVSDSDRHDAIMSVWHLLKPIQREVVRRRLAGETLREISGDLGVTRERVRQIENSAKRAIYELVTGEDGSNRKFCCLRFGRKR